MKKTGKIVLVIVALIIDLLVYILLGIALMNYDDFYDGSQEKYRDWSTMAPFDKYVFIGWILWNSVNLILIANFIYLILKKWRKELKRKL